MVLPKFEPGQKVKTKSGTIATIKSHQLEKSFTGDYEYWMYNFKEFSSNFYMNEDQLEAIKE